MPNHDAACFALAVPARVSGDGALRQQLQPKRGRRRKRKGRRKNKGRGYVTQFQLQAMVMSEVEKRERDQPSARRLRFERDVALVKLDKAQRRIQQLEKSSVELLGAIAGFLQAREIAIPFYQSQGWEIIDDPYEIVGIGPHRSMMKHFN